MTSSASGKPPVITDDQRQALVEAARRQWGADVRDLLPLAIRWPDFLRDGHCLLEAVVRLEGGARHSWFTLTTDASPVVACAVAPHSNGDVLAPFQPARSFLKLTRDSAGAFVRAVTEVDPQLGMFIDRADSVEWFTPLNELEACTLDREVRAEALRVTEEDEHAYAFEGGLLRGGQLYRAKGKVYHRFKRRSFNSLDRHPGEVELETSATAVVIVEGLPSNCRPRRTRPRPSSGAGAAFVWEPIDADEIDLIALDLARRVVPVFARELVSAMARSWVAHYQMDLLQIQTSKAAGGERFYVLWRPGFAMPVHTDSSPLHELNELLAAQRGWRIASEADAVSYLAFFNEFVWGDAGPFHLVQRSEDDCFLAGDPETLVVRPGTTVEEIRAALAPPAVQARDDGTFVLSSCHVFYGGTLYRCALQLADNGLIWMRSDEWLMTCRRKDGKSWNFARPGIARRHPLAACHDGIEAIRNSQARPRVVSAAAFIEELTQRAAEKGGCQIRMEERVVVGSVRAEGMEVSQGLLIENCRFRALVDLSHLSCGGKLAFRNCVFEAGLILARAQIGGGLEFVHTTVIDGKVRGGLASCDFSDARASTLSALNLTVHGDLFGARLQSQGTMTFSGVQTTGSLDLEGVSCGGPLYVYPSRWEQGRVGGNLNLCFGRAVLVLLHLRAVTGSVLAAYAIVDQFVRVGQSGDVSMRIGHRDEPRDGEPGLLSLYGTIVNHNFVSLKNVDVAGSIAASFLRVGTGVFLGDPQPGSDVRIGGDLELGGAEIPQVLGIRRTSIGRTFAARGITAGEVKIVGCYSNKSSEANGGGVPDDASATPEHATPRIDLVDLRPIVVGRAIDFADAEIRRNAHLVGVECRGHGDEGGTSSAVCLRGASVGGDLRLWASSRGARTLHLVKETEPVGEDGFRCVVPRGVNLTKAVVKGDVILAHVDSSQGVIDLTDMEIGRDLEVDAAPGRPRARSQNVKIVGLRCEGSVNLTGLDLVQSTTGEEHGHVLGRNAIVRQQMIVADGQSAATIPGRLDLCFSELGSLDVSPASFQGRVDARALQAHGILLNRATVGKMTVLAEGKVYPRPIDLRYAEVGWWEFRGHDLPESDDANNYIRLLEGEPHQQRHTWRSIEASLINRGHEDAADEVHQAMRRCVLRVAAQDVRRRPFCRRPGGWLRIGLIGAFDFFTHSQTSPARLLIIVFLWLSISTHLFSIPGNVGPTEERMAATVDVVMESDRPDSREWDLSSGFWVALRYHVPIALFTAQDEWEPHNAEHMMVWKDSDGWWTFLGTPEDYANLVLMCHWLVWPAIIVIASRKFFRRSER